MNTSALKLHSSKPQAQTQPDQGGCRNPPARRVPEMTRGAGKADSWELHRAARRMRDEAIGEAVANILLAIIRRGNALWTHLTKARISAARVDK